MNGERVGDIVLHGNDAIRFAYMLYHPTEEELLYNRSVLERIDNNITITERDNGYDAESGFKLFRRKATMQSG